MKLKLINLKIAPLPLFLLLSICQDSYGMSSKRSRGKPASATVLTTTTLAAGAASRATPTAAAAAAAAAPSPIDLATASAGTSATAAAAPIAGVPPTSVIERALLVAAGASTTGADKSIVTDHRPGLASAELLTEAPAAAAAPPAIPDTESGQLTYREALVGVDLPSLRVPGPGAPVTRPASPRLTLKIIVPKDTSGAAVSVSPSAAPVAPIAMHAGELTSSPHATADGATPPSRPTLVHDVAAVSADAGTSGEAEKTIVIDTGSLPIVERVTGALWVAAGYPEEYKHTDKDGVIHVRVGRFQRALVNNAKSSKEADVAHAFEMLAKYKIGIGAPFADATFDSLQASSDAKCAELEAQIAQFSTKLQISATEDLDRYLATIATLARQIELRKQGKLLAAERATSAGSEIARSKSPIGDYTPGDNSAAKEKLMAALTTYIDETRSCFVPKVKAAARLARTSSTGAGDGSGGGASGSSDRSGASTAVDKR